MANSIFGNIIDLVFSGTNDEFNWIHNTSSGLNTLDDVLVFTPETTSSTFRRGLGSINAGSNRLVINSMIEISRPSSSGSSVFCAVFGIYNGSVLVDEVNIYSSDLAAGSDTKYFVNREIDISGYTGDISIRISFPDNSDNNFNMSYLKVYDYEYNQETVRTYFNIGDFFESAKDAQSAVFKIIKLEVDNIETLTQEFFNENSNKSSTPVNDWFLAKADLDGKNRVFESLNPNSFNPFINDLGLNFSVDDYYSGKPIGILSGSDYGSKILDIGICIPEVMNGVLESEKGSFFMDIDYSKSFKMVFEVVSNENSTSLYSSPTIYREYTVFWDEGNCEKKYYYKDLNDSNTVTDILESGFLYGLTGFEDNTQVVQCDESFSPSGGEGFFEYEIDFGTETGLAGINYNAASIPDKFDIEWDGNLYTTGYVGSSVYDQSLINAGVPQSEINTANPSNGQGVLNFTKDKSTPSKATIRVYGTSGTGWSVSGICPEENIVTVDDINLEYEEFSSSGPDGGLSGNVITTQRQKEIEISPSLVLGQSIQLSLDYNVNGNDSTSENTIFYQINGGDKIIIDSLLGSGSITGDYIVNIGFGEVLLISLENKRDSTNSGAETIIYSNIISANSFAGSINVILGDETTFSNTIITS